MNTKPNSASGFVMIQSLIVFSAVACGAYRARERAVEWELPPMRDQPLEVRPLFDNDLVITDEQLRRVLSKLGLRFVRDETMIGHTDHMLRCWGPHAKFTQPEFMSGQDMLRLLTDHGRFAKVYGEDRDPLLIDEGTGVRVRAFEGNTSSSHVDHTLACLAEVGTPLHFPIVTPTRRTTYRAMVEQSLRDFSLNQGEYEWSALAYVLFLPPTSRWITSEGQEVSFDRLAERIMRERLPHGVCSANHRLHALVMFLRVDDQMDNHEKILSPQVRTNILEFLREVTATFVQHQHADGFWNTDWHEAAPESREPNQVDGDRMRDRIIVTGHVMEWWALAPCEVQPPRAALAAAGQWLVRTIDSLTPEQIQQYNSFLSHAGRALTMWRGKMPAEVELTN